MGQVPGDIWVIWNEMEACPRDVLETKGDSRKKIDEIDPRATVFL